MIKTFLNALRGIFILIKTERNFQIHIIALLCVLCMGIQFRINPYEWLALLSVSALVLSLEALNTALEKLCNEVTLERKEGIRNVKDIAAGAVLIAAAIALIIGGIVFYPYIQQYLPSK